MMRRGIAWIIMGLVVVVIVVSAYALIQVLQEPAGGGTPTPTKTPEAEASPTLVIAAADTNTPPATLTIATETPIPATPTPTLFPTPTPTPIPPTPTPSATPYVISAGEFSVNVRLEPGTGDVPVIGVLGVDQDLAIVGKNPDGTWWQVCCMDGQTGWVFTEVVQAIGPLEGVPIAPEFGEESGTTPTVPATTDTPVTIPTATPTATSIATATLTPTAPPATSGQIRGMVYWDRNGNGARDEDEAGLAGATISIYRLPDMGSMGDKITGEDGVFFYEDLQPGRYTIYQTVHSGFTVEASESVVTVVVEAGQATEVSFRNAPLP